MPSLSQTANTLIHVLAFAMAVLEFLLRCFRWRTDRSEQSRPLCTQEESSQPEINSDLQPVSTAYTQALPHQPVTPPAKSIAVFAPPPAQHDSLPQQLSLGPDSSFGFPGTLQAQVGMQQYWVWLKGVKCQQNSNCCKSATQQQQLI